MAGKLGNEAPRKVESTADDNGIHCNDDIAEACGKFTLDLLLFNQLFQLEGLQNNNVFLCVTAKELQSYRGWLEVWLYPAKQR